MQIGRLSPTSNIYGISTDGYPLMLWDEKGVGVHSVPLNLGPELASIRSIGGVDNGYARGFFASNSDGDVFNIYWEDGWQTKELITPSWWPAGSCSYVTGWTHELFGNFGDQTYILYAQYTTTPELYCSDDNEGWTFVVYRLDYVGGPNRHDLVEIGSG